MVKYSCEKCGKNFFQKSHYTSHINRKNPCVQESKIESIITNIINKQLDKKMNDEYIYIPKQMNKETMGKEKVITKKFKKIDIDITTPLTFVDLFCGIGSFHHSFIKKGWKCIMACDIDPSTRETYRSNYGVEPLGDIYDIEPKNIEHYNILCAGFPCQPFSQAGKQKGFSDERGILFFQIMKFVKYHKPEFIILENVQGLLKHNDGRSFSTIKTLVEKENYHFIYKVLLCSDYGIPQMRKRLFMIGIKKNIRLSGNIEDMLNFKDYEKKTSLSKYLGKKFSKTHAYTIRCGGKNSPINDRHNWDGYMVDGKEYRLTIQDVLALQGFEKDFLLCGNDKNKWKQLGNTIPTVFTDMISSNITKIL
jgi:DNA (cytosine-5)-methyltransferase 1